MASKTKLDRNLLKSLEPLGNLAYDKLEELASKSVIDDLPTGRVLFREGEKDNRILYLISGQVEFQHSGDKKPRLIKARNSPVQQPLDNHQPHTGNARAKSPITVLTIDADLLEIILNDTPLDAYEFEVTEISGEDTTDWMLRFLQSRAFLKLPTDNIQAILMRMEDLPAKKGDVILRQGDQDDYYYIVQSGSCAVTRRPAPKAGEIQLATLQEGDGFGEEALITNGRRNANVSMREDGVLMRLKKEDFLTYLAEPLITRFSENDTAAKLDSGALLIDVRKHEEFNQQHVDGSVNIPLSMLRLKLGGLNPNREYILASADGTQSEAAAFLLTQHGFQCGILDGGLEATSFKLTGSSNPAAAVDAAPASKQTAAAEKTRQAAEDQARKISQQADNARREAAQLAKQTADAEQAKTRAEQEILRLAEQNQQAEQAAREKAEQARRQAEAELHEIQSAKQANEEKQQALDASLKRAKQIAAEASEAAKRSREQAEKEAEEIRRKAREEAENLKQEMEATRRRFEQQTSQAEQEKEAQRQAAIDQARKEAETIRQQAQSEAERLRNELEAAKQAVDQRAAKVEQEERQKQVSLLEKARSRAMELAEKTTRIAEQEAEEIRRKALEEAEQLRQEMEQTRQQVMEHATRAQDEARRQTEARAQQEAEEQARRDAKARAKEQAKEQARRDAEARAKQQAEEQARRDAKARAKQQAEEQARRDAEARAKEQANEQARHEAEARAKEQANEQARHEAEARAKEQAEEEQARRDAEARAKQQADQQARHEAEARAEQAREARRQQAIRQAQHRRQEQTRRMAEEIKAKLEQAEQQRQDEEQRQRGEGLSVARATLKRKDGRIILEGEEDIFIFKEPDITPEQMEAELAREPQQQARSQTGGELPSFEIEENDKPVFKPINTQAVNARLAEQQTSQQQQRKKRHLFALAATLLLALGSSGVYLFLHPELLNEHLIVRSESGKSTTAKASVGTLNNADDKDKDKNKNEDQSGQKHENNLEASLRERFDTLVQEWKEIIAP